LKDRKSPTGKRTQGLRSLHSIASSKGKKRERDHGNRDLSGPKLGVANDPAPPDNILQKESAHKGGG